MDLYAENILDHYRAPRGKWALGSWQLASSHTESNPACGDEITVGMNIRGGCIEGIQWDGTGCAISQAAMSMLSEELAGKTVDTIDRMQKEDVLTLLGVPISARRLKCALLGLHTLKNTMHAARGEQPQGWSVTIREIHGSHSFPQP